MRFWNSSLNKINLLLADLYLEKQTAIRLAIAATLPTEKIAFSDRAVDNWHNILLTARKTGQLKNLLTILIEDSQNQDLAVLSDQYVNTPDVLGGGAAAIFRWLKLKWRLAVAVAASLVVLTVGGFAIFYYLVPVTLSGHVSCASPQHRLGEHLQAATVRIPGTSYEAITKTDGSFTLKVPRRIGVKTVEVLYGSGTYNVLSAHHLNNDLRVVHCNAILEPAPKNIPFGWWKPTDISKAQITCDVTGEFPRAKLYTLQPDWPIQRTQSGELIVNVVTLGAWEILDALVTRPLNTGDTQQFAETTGLRGPQKRQWAFDMPVDFFEIRIQVCFGTRSLTHEFSEASLDSNYYFQ